MNLLYVNDLERYAKTESDCIPIVKHVTKQKTSRSTASQANKIKQRRPHCQNSRKKKCRQKYNCQKWLATAEMMNLKDHLQWQSTDVDCPACNVIYSDATNWRLDQMQLLWQMVTWELHFLWKWCIPVRFMQVAKPLDTCPLWVGNLSHAWGKIPHPAFLYKDKLSFSLRSYH